MGLVATWLNGIGLTYAVPSFQAAGIDNPAALAELDVSHFEALGVVNAQDRRKLFFLVQRIKMAVERKDETSTATKVDAILAQTMGPSMALDREQAVQPDLEMSPSRIHQHTTTTTTAAAANNNNNNKSTSSSLPMRVHQDNNNSNNSGVVASARATAAMLQQPSRSTETHDNPYERDSDGDDEWHDTDEDQVVIDESWHDTDEDMIRTSNNNNRSDGAEQEALVRRQNRRLLEQRCGSENRTDSCAPPEDDSTLLPTRRLSSLSQPAAAPPNVSVRRRTSSRRATVDSHDLMVRPDSTANTQTTLPNTTKPVVRRQTGVPLPGRRSDFGSSSSSRLPSMRTGKQLSSIPANSIAPMSPLVDLAATKLAQQQQQASDDDELYYQAGRRRSMSSRHAKKGGSIPPPAHYVSSDSDNESLSSLPRVRRGRARSNSSAGAWRSASESASPTHKRIITRSHSSMESSGAGQHGHHKRTSTSSTADSSSFKAQIAQLRQTNAADYELFAAPPHDNTTADAADDMRIRVVVRKRPMSTSEIVAAGDIDVIHPFDHGSYGRVLVYHPKTRVDLTKSVETIPFAFDNVFYPESTNAEVYERTVRPLIPDLFAGQWATIFAYGQTGSGKTFTMMGGTTNNNNRAEDDQDDQVHPYSNLGLYYMAALDLFQAIETPGFEDNCIAVSLFEIYGGKLFDLLHHKEQIKCLEDQKGKICFPGLTEHGVTSADELMELIQDGARHRSTGTTSRNADSSRSHAVLQLHLQTTTTSSSQSSSSGDREVSRLTFIDLAGSERGADTATASRSTRLEGAEINTSLLSLKEVIRALATGDSLAHVPFRGSKLTQVLKESFVGKDGRSVMIACVSPNIGNVETTLNTLRYADRVKERNPETGELSVAIKPVARAPPTTTSAQLLGRLPADRKSPGGGRPSPTTSPPRPVSAAGGNSADAALLDELLATPSTDMNGDASHQEEEDDDESRFIAYELITEHKTAMSTMLAMVKDEMTLVNQADAEREGLGDYITELCAIHEQQLSFIASLREHLLEYRLAQSKEQSKKGSGGFLSDESFEDLRD